MKVPVSFRTRYAMADKRILVDSGALDNFIHPKFVKRLHIGMQELEHPWNIDGTLNKAEKLTHFVHLCKELTVDDSNSLLWIDKVYSDSGERGTKARDDEGG